MKTLAPFAPLLALAVPVVLFFLLSRFGGWSTLAEHYPLLSDPPPPRTRMGYLVFRGWLGYNGAVIVSADAAGLYLRSWPLLSFCHAPIAIPWSQLREIRRRQRWNGRVYALATRRAPEVDVALLERTFELVRDTARAAGVPGEY